jgi:anti-sigma-K factor RskA
MWSRIEHALPPAVAPPVQADNIVALRRAATNWRRAAIMSGALAAGLLIFVVRQEALAPQTGVYFAAINRGGDQPALIVRVDMATQTVYVRPISAETPEGKSLELWIIPSGEKPRSMGVVHAGSERLPTPRGFAIEKATLAVTVEPEGGSPTGGPTGPIVYSGILVRE